jgi:hypothetical protein
VKAEAPSENPRTPESKSSAKDPQTPRTRTGQPHQKDLSPATPKQIRKRKILDDDLTPPRPEVNPEMAERIGLIMGERNKKRQAKVKDAHAKRLIRESGLDFNLHFQKMHAGMVVEKSHWSSFKKCIAGEGDLTCAVCQNLVVHHCIKISRFEAEGSQATDQNEQRQGAGDRDPGAGDRDPGADALALVPVDNSTAKRRKVGRPRKDTDEEKFDLRNFMQAERPNLYSFLTEEQVRDRLPVKSQDDEQLLKREMAKNPAMCNACRVVMHFQVVSNDRQLQLGCLRLFETREPQVKAINQKY